MNKLSMEVSDKLDLIVYFSKRLQKRFELLFITFAWWIGVFFVWNSLPWFFFQLYTHVVIQFHEADVITVNCRARVRTRFVAAVDKHPNDRINL